MAIMGYCDHPNIASIKSILFHPKQFSIWIIQPKYYIDLEKILFNRRQSIIIKNFKKTICCQILEALQYLHKKDVVHLDLKPSNIMLKSQLLPDIVLLDFGISNIYKNSENTNIFGITPFYCPPEIKFNNPSSITPKADIFSFGIVFYEIVTEKKSFAKYQSKPSGQIYNLIRSQDFDFFQENQSTGNADIDSIISQCVKREASQRPTAQETLEMIQKVQF
eukprot:TRINITY_DN4012_c0_g1_i5.p1 TRINITY_DN4012_c0_g1~~TRINITY_DN4012_c0_g1_i5.p1  ORF type:complete len:221 (+),score=23.10 TRINITY_DN4012_c0_g1_i5:266-928(+)